MCPNLNLRLLSLVILLIPGSLCLGDQLYESCQKPFQCSGMSIDYPFSGDDNRPPPCGRRGFELRCQDGIPRIDINSVSYRVLAIENAIRTLKVSRDDLWSDLCPRFLHNTTFNSTPFNYYPKANDQEIYLFYGCASLPSQLEPYQFRCNMTGAGMNSLSYFQYPGAIPRSGNGNICGSYMSVRVNETAARQLEAYPTQNLLLAALKSGFWIQWSPDNTCSSCVQSGGACGQNLVSGSFACHCSDRTHNSSCSIQTRNGSKFRKNIMIAVKVIAAAAGMLLSAFIVCRIKTYWQLHKLNKIQGRHVNNILPEAGNGSLAPKRYSYREIKKITRSFTDKIGEGGYGIVYKGWLPDDQIVAVKVLTETSSTSDGEEFINEVASISRTSHVNVVNLLGFCYNGRKRALVYEFMPNKSLDQFIFRGLLEWKAMEDIAIGVARGLEYLHKGCNSKIIHFDIKPQNILLDEDFCPKISDFGLAKMFKKKQSMISVLGTRGTIGYIAPEVCFRSYGAVSHKSDVYSYGMVLLDMAGARKIDQTEATVSSENYFHDKIYAALNNGKLDDLSTTEEDGETAKKILLVGLWCIQTAPSDRPSMTKVVEMLQGSIQSIPVPPKPSLCFASLPKPQFSSAFSIDVEIDL